MGRVTSDPLASAVLVIHLNVKHEVWDENPRRADVGWSAPRFEPPALWTLIDRDHEDIDRALGAITDAATSIEDTITELDGLRIGFAAHAIAQHRVLRAVLHRQTVPPPLQFLVAQSAATHRVQEAAVWSLAYQALGSRGMRQRARELRDAMHDDAERETACLRPALVDYLSPSAYRELAPAYATQRLRLFGEVDQPQRWPRASRP